MKKGVVENTETLELSGFTKFFDIRHFNNLEHPVQLLPAVYLLIIQALLVPLAFAFKTGIFSSPAAQQSSNVGMAGLLTGVVVAETLLVLVVVALWKKLPEWLREQLKLAVGVVLYLWLGHMLWLVGGMHAAVVFGAVVLVVEVMRHFDLYWLLHNGAAVLFITFMAGFVGAFISPVVVVAFMGLLLVWDVVAVNFSNIMTDFVSSVGDSTFPLFMVFPTSWRLDMAEVRGFVKGDRVEKPGGLSQIIGNGDFAVPSMLFASVLVGWSGPVMWWGALGVAAGCVVGMGLLGVVPSSGEDVVPALVPLNVWALLGLVVGLVPLLFG